MSRDATRGATVRDVTPVEAVQDWLAELARRRAQRTVGTPGGFAVRDDAYPLSHDHNKLLVQGPCDGAALAAATVRVLDGLGHRLVEFRTPELADLLGPSLTGYERSDNRLLAWSGATPGRRPTVELNLAGRTAVASAVWTANLPGASPEVWRQLGERVVRMTRACTPIFLATLGPDGVVACTADLYVHQGIAQVEEVLTVPAYQGQGLATGVVLDAVARGFEAGASAVVIVADADDWPLGWYRRLGFVGLGRTSSFSRVP